MGELDKVIEQVNKEHKFDIINKGLRKYESKKIPLSSIRLNYMTYGGIPRGHIIELAGAENSGKTTLALDIIKNAQVLFQNEWEQEIEKLKNDNSIKAQNRLKLLEQIGPKKCIYADCENTLDELWVRKLGVDLDNLVTITPQQETAEQLFDIFIDMLSTGEVGLLIIDSLGVMISQQAFDKSIGEKTYAGISQPLTTFSKKASLLCCKFGITLIGINQLRDDLSTTYNTYTTTGGRGWKHACSVRLMISKSDFIDDNNNKIPKSTAENPAGNLVDVAIIKTKAFKPDRRKGLFTIRYDLGIDNASDLVDVALKYDLLVRRGAWYSFFNDNNTLMEFNGVPLTFNGKAELLSFLRKEQEFTNQLVDILNSHI